MNTNKLYYVVFSMLTLLILSVNINVYAGNVTCDKFHRQGKKVCESKTYKGKKCAWDDSKKGGVCYDSGKLADKAKENITSCTQIKEPDICNSSKIEGHECIWRQNACYNNTIIDDGSNETIIADDQKDRNNQEQHSNDQGTIDNKCPDNYIKNNKGECVNLGYVAENACDENDIKKVLQLFGYILLVAKIMVPLIIIGFGTFDLFKSVVDKDEKSLGKQIKQLGLRLLAGFIVFFIPNIVYAIFGLSDALNIIDTAEYKTCAECILEPTKCNVN